MNHVSLADAKAHLSDLVDRVERGATIDITRRGKLVARLVAAPKVRQPVDATILQAFTTTLPPCPETSADLVRSMRDGDRY